MKYIYDSVIVFFINIINFSNSLHLHFYPKALIFIIINLNLINFFPFLSKLHFFLEPKHRVSMSHNIADPYFHSYSYLSFPVLHEHELFSEYQLVFKINAYEDVQYSSLMKTFFNL